MSSHPNVILMAVLTPSQSTDKDSPRQTLHNLLAYNDADEYDSLIIGDVKYRAIFMRDDYESDIQIAAKENDLVFYDLVTYGYGSTITWQNLCKRQQALETWAAAMAEKFNCKYNIVVGANYW